MRTLVCRSVVPALCALLVSGSQVWAQEAASPLKEAAKPIQESAAADVVEPDSIKALEAMGAVLSNLKTFKLDTDFEAEIVLDSDQKVEIGGSTNYQVRRPDGLRAHLESDFGSRDFIYDGKVLTVVDPKQEVYGQVEVAPTIKQMLEQVAFHLDIELPLADLFDFGTADAPQNIITEGFFVSDAKVGGTPAKHWAYRTDAKDFELWIEDGETALPLKLVITDDTDPARPRFETNLHWTTDPDIPADTFTYTPPETYEQIDFLPAQGTPAQEGTK